MLRKLCRTASFVVLPIFFISSIIFLGIHSAYALSNEANGDNPLKIVIEKSTDNANMDDKTIDEFNVRERPDLGDDQVFPFVAGLDSYEAMR